MKKVACPAKHARPQIPDAEWHCRYCGADSEDEKPFVIENPDVYAQEGCELLHENDEICCWSCGDGTTGKQFAAAYAKQKALLPCPTCQGAGYVNS